MLLQVLLAELGVHGIKRGRYDVFIDDKRGQSPPTTSAFAPVKSKKIALVGTSTNTITYDLVYFRKDFEFRYCSIFIFI